MNGNCHFMFGASVGVSLALNIDTLNNLISLSNNGDITTNGYIASTFILGGILGGIFPDIDNPSSYMGKLSKPVSTVIGKVSAICGKKGSHHRGIFHDFGVYLVLLFLSYFFCPYAIGFLIGCISHLILDMFNPSGVPCILARRSIHLGKITSDSKSAIILSVGFTVLTLLFGIGMKLWMV